MRANRRRTKTAKNKRLQRLRSERAERSFAHVCETGGSRRTWLHGIEKVRKRLLTSAMTRNLGLVMRRLLGMGTPRGLQKPRPLAALAWLAQIATRRLIALLPPPWRCPQKTANNRRIDTAPFAIAA
ncbi:transposase [Botrimarina hoheduenensis]|uniref:transposase n=1 Tax=Botrimarina hoheduenensis TaxID=2528000 RepID=UPI0011B555E6